MGTPVCTLTNSQGHLQWKKETLTMLSKILTAESSRQPKTRTNHRDVKKYYTPVWTSELQTAHNEFSKAREVEPNPIQERNIKL